MTTSAERLHMSLVAGLGCVICHAPAEIHHMKTNPITGRHLGMGQRASNFHVIPLCPRHHRQGRMGEAYHSGPRAWEVIHGTEIELWAKVQELLRSAA